MIARWYARLMIPIGKAALQTLLLVIPVVLKWLLPDEFKWWWLLAYSGIVFVGATFAFQPKAKFVRIRTSMMDHVSKQLLSDLFPGESHCYRLLIFKPVAHMTLHPVYSYQVKPDAADADIWFWRWQGLTGQVFHLGQAGYVDSLSGSFDDFRLSNKKKRKTDAVTAIAAFPLRRIDQASHEFADRSVRAILTIDCVSNTRKHQEALKKAFDKLSSHKRTSGQEKSLSLIADFFC